MKPFAQCNHPPKLTLNGDATQDVVQLSVALGAEVKLSIAGTDDPDGDKLTCRWWVYKDAGTYWTDPPVRGNRSGQATMTVPAEGSGRTLHVILEVTDDGGPPLTRYRRLVIQVTGKVRPRPEDKYLTTPITRLTGPPPETGKWAFASIFPTGNRLSSLSP